MPTWKFVFDRAISKQQISDWFDGGNRRGSSYMLIVCDKFDWEDYPVYVTPDRLVAEVIKEYASKSMQQIMEVYDLLSAREPQLAHKRCLAAPIC